MKEVVDWVEIFYYGLSKGLSLSAAYEKTNKGSKEKLAMILKMDFCIEPGTAGSS